MYSSYTISFHLPLMHILFINRSFIAETNNYNENVKNQTHLEINEKKNLLECEKNKKNYCLSNLKCNKHRFCFVST